MAIPSAHPVSSTPPDARASELPWALTADPAEFMAGCWTELVAGARESRHGFHTGTLATVSADGSPQARTLVLRWVDPAARTVGFHVDARSAKAREIVASPKSAWVAYDPAQRLQVRLCGHARLHAGDDIARARWLASSVSGRLAYLTPHPPGSVVSQPPPQAGRSLNEWEGFENFAAVVFQPVTFDAVFLHSGGHRRVQAGPEAPRWVAP